MSKRQKEFCPSLYIVVTLLLTIFNRADAVVDPWLENLWQKILQLYPLPPGISVIPNTVQYVGLL